MAHFQISNGVAIKEFFLDSTPKPDGGQRRLKLQLNGWDSGKPPDIRTGTGGFARIVETSHNARSRLSTFTVEAVKDAKGVAYIYDHNSPKQEGAMLRLTIGEVTNHKGFTYDLIAELLGRSENPIHIWVYQRILAAKNNELPVDRKDWDRLLADQPLKQSIAKMDCGTAMSRFGANYFGQSHFVAASTKYYKPFQSQPKPEDNKRADIKFDDDLVRRGAEGIRGLLMKKQAVRVFAVHHDGFTADKHGTIQQSGKTHFLTIVGCDAGATKFLYTDPWPGGARLRYTSGILGDVETAFMGTMDFTTRGGNVISTSVSNHGGGLDCMLLTGPP